MGPQERFIPGSESVEDKKILEINTTVMNRTECPISLEIISSENAHDFVLTCVEFNNDSIGATIHSQLYKKDSLDDYLFKDSNLTKTDPVTKQPIDLGTVAK
jgi:hypothetical protein